MQHNPLHYPTLDRCKKLTELGFPETQLHWSTLEQYRRPAEIMEYNIPGAVNYVCPSIAELLDVIPKRLNGKCFIIKMYHCLFVCGYEDRHDLFSGIKEPYLPNALTDVVIALVKEGEISFKK